MFFHIIGIAGTRFKKNSKKNSSTLQTQKATDFCITKRKYCSNTIDVFPDSMPYSKVFPFSVKADGSERTFLSTLCSGIITSEAAIVLPFFILAVSSVLYLFNVIYIEAVFQERLSEISRQISQTAYISNMFSSLSDNGQNNFLTLSDENNFGNSPTNDNLFDDFAENIGASLITSAYIKNIFLNDELNSFVDSSYIVNKQSGISFLETKYDSDEYILSVTLSYSISIPFLPQFIKLDIKQFCKINLFCGKNITTNEGNTDLYVYICNHGNVYHTNKYCSYLIKYTKVIPIEEIHTLALVPCLHCQYLDLGLNNKRYVYITESGDCYHFTLDCTTFFRDVYSIKYTELPDYFEICTRCEEGIQ